MQAESRHEQNLIGKQAAMWLTALAGGDAAQRPAFVKWLKRSPRHVEEFLLVSAVWRGLDGAGPADAAGIERLLAQAAAGPAASNVVALEQTSPPAPASLPAGVGHGTPAPRRLLWRYGLAAGLACLALGALWAPSFVSAWRNTYTTATGEQRTVRLADGSVVYLNARSRLNVRYSAGARELTLSRGEALFKVERDPARPFRVHSGAALVRVLGTQFNVYRRAGATTVAVLEGKVQVLSDAAHPGRARAPAPVQLGMGEAARIIPGGGIVREAHADLERATAWRKRRLVFREERLEDIAAEFARYSPRRILPEDAAARNKRITGTFDADNPQSLVLFLEKLNDLQVQGRGEEFVVRGR